MNRILLMKKTLLTLSLLAAALAAGPVQGAVLNLNNFGFETGQLESDANGWLNTFDSSQGTGAIQGSFSDPVATPEYPGYGYNYSPNEGSSFLVLTAGDPDMNVKVVRYFDAAAGDTLQGAAAFASGEPEESYWNDWAAVRISKFSDPQDVFVQPFYMDVAGVGQQGYTDWTTWTWTALEAGHYRIEYIVTNDLDYAAASYALFDAAPVPLPPSLLLLAPSLIGLLALRRRSAR